MTAPAEGGWLTARGSVRALCLLRAIVGVLTLVHLAPFLEEMAAGRYYADSFHVPFLELLPTPGRGLYFAMLSGCALTAALMAVGALTRVTTALTFAFVLYNVLLNQLHHHHNRAFLIAILFGLTLLPVGRELSVDAWWRRRRGRALPLEVDLWPLLAMRILGCAPYLASGSSKLVDPEWWGGVVMADRVARYRHRAEAAGVPEAILDLLAEPSFHAVFWKLIVCTELFVGVGLWIPRARYAAIFMAVIFHVNVELTSSVQIFSYLGVAATLMWVTPSARDRRLVLDVDTARGRRLAARVRRLDWLARFEVEEVRGAADPVTLIDRDGRRYVGPWAARYAMSRLPLLAFPMLPTLLRGRPRAP